MKWLKVFLPFAGALFAQAAIAQTDTQAPTVPAELAATSVSSSRIDLKWSASTDNVGVAWYTLLFGDLRPAITVSGNVTSYSDTGLVPSTAYTYRLIACDAANNCSTPTAEVAGTTSRSGATISVIGGWNLVGNSSSAGLDVVTAFGDASKVATIWKWIPSAASWAFYAPSLIDGGATYAQPRGYSVLTTINGGEGFWVNAKTGFTVQLPDAAPITSVLVKGGFSTSWNLISTGDTATPGEFNNSLSATVPPPGVIPTNVTTLWAWDAAKAKWYFYGPSLDAKGGTTLTDYIDSKSYLDFSAVGRTLGPGVGFWINYPAAATCSVSGSAAQGGTTLLTSMSGDGVLGCPATLAARFPTGTTVPYAFVPAPGYAQASVLIDGVLAASSGTLTMDKDHWLWAFGDAQSGTTLPGMMTVPSDFTQIPYPTFYQNPPSFNFTVADPYCATTSAVVAYPTSFLGAFPLPTVQGAPLPASVHRGAFVHDKAWDARGITDASQNYLFGCRGDLHGAFLATLARLKKLGADHVVIFRDTQVADAKATQLHILPWADFSVPDSEMVWIAAQAKAFGLQVWEHRQLVEQDVNNVLLPDTPTLEWATMFLDAYIRFVVDRAAVAQQNGVAAFLLDWSGYKGVTGWGNGNIISPELSALFKAKMATAALQVRSVYSGKILFGGNVNSLTTYDQAFLDSIDWMFNELGGTNVSATDNMNITVPMLKQKYLDDIARFASLGDRTKPRVWLIKSESYRDFLVNGFVEDMYCVNGCMQRDVPTDFSVQAIAYEAMLEAIAEQTAFATVAVDAASYWFADVILPMDSFPNLSFSWRNKPAESIIYQWYKR